VSKPHYRCAGCKRRVKRAPYISIQDKSTQKITCYRGGDCAEAGLREAYRPGPDEMARQDWPQWRAA
jgi:hypothetical protein